MKTRKSTAFAFGLVLLTAIGCQTESVSRALPIVRLETALGAISIEVDTVNAPVTAANFLQYVDESRLDSAHFYRVVTLDNQPNDSIKIDIVQWGLGNRSHGQRLPPIDHETTDSTGIAHLAGTVSMARLQPGSASSEFFICVTDQPELDYGGHRNPDGQGFAAFGHVTGGMEVVRAIQQQPGSGQTLSQPVEISSIHRVAE